MELVAQLEDMRIPSQLILYYLIIVSSTIADPYEKSQLKNRVKHMFYHAYDGYTKYAFPLDELRPLSCDGHDTWGSFSLTLVDALDTLAVMGNWTEFRHASRLLLNHLDVNRNVNVSVFETNIRVVGGLLSAHLFSRRADFEVETSWPCSGPLLRMAEAFARKLLPAFDTPTGMPYGTVNLAQSGVPPGETTVSCVAGIGTFIIEFGVLSRLTGDQRFERAALRAVKALWNHRSDKNLLGNHIDISTGKWTATEATIGAGVDSYFEYLVKGSALFRMPELEFLFREYKKAIDGHMLQGDWHFVVNKDSAHITTPIFQSLQAFWPSILSLTGYVDDALLHLTAYHEVWKQYGFIPEGYNFLQRKVVPSRTGYLLRPEFIESVYHIYRATRDPWLIRVAVDVLTSIEQVARTDCGYATVMDVTSHSLENRMESFFLSETTKYLYLTFDEANFIHDDVLTTRRDDDQPVAAGLPHSPAGGLWACQPESGGYIFNTEAHPMDPGALGCCTVAPSSSSIGPTGAPGGSPSSPPVEASAQETVRLLNGDGWQEETVVEKTKRQLGDLLDVINEPFESYFTEPASPGVSSTKQQQSQVCSSQSEMDQSVLDTWKELNSIVMQFSATDNRPGSVLSSMVAENDDLFSVTNLEAVRPPLLTCRYPAFHERFTLAGQLATQI